MDRSQPDRERFSLLWALAVSVLLHLLLVLLGGWLPILSPPAAAEPFEETPLHFTFAPTEPAEAQPRVTRGETPFPTPPTPASPPTLAPAMPPEGVAELEPLPPVPQPPEPQALPAEVPSEPVPEEEPADAEAGLPAVEEGGLTGGPSAGARGARERPALDVDRALQDFRRARNGAASNPPGVPLGRSQSTFVPDPSSLPMPGAPFGILEFESRDYDWNDYARQIYFAILRAWYDRLFRTTAEFEKWSHQTGEWWLDHRSRIRFVIEGNGQVTGITLERTSSCPPLDDSALHALAEVVLPPLPEDFPRQREVVHATFLARLAVQDMRPLLQSLRNAGYF